MFKKIIITIVAFISLTSCEDYLDIKPVGKIIPTSLEDYRKFITSGYNIKKKHKQLQTYRSDELHLIPSVDGIEQFEDIYLWKDNSNGALTTEFPYAAFYSTIFYTNQIINNKNKIEGDSSDLNQLVGEAYALRALQYFDLVNLYGKPYNKTTASTDKGVPIVLTYDSDKDYQKSSVQEIYNLILSDIEEAENLLNISIQETGLNYRFSVLALKTLKSQVYLYMQDWEKASISAQESLGIKSDLQDLNSIATILPSEYNSVESILALDFVASFDINSNSTISDDLINSYDPVNDLRFGINFKQTSNEFNSVKSEASKFRCTYRTADLYLTLAEAQARLNKLPLAKDILLKLAKNRYNAIGYSSFETNLNSLNQTEIISLILKERQREFAIEGKRWFDLRRTAQAEIVKIFDGVTYTLQQGDDRYTLPFPKSATISNPLLN